MLHDAQNSQNFIKYFSSKIADFFIHKSFFIVQKLPKLDSQKFKQFLKKNILWNFVNSGHHGASLGASRGCIDILNPFRFFNLESCIVNLATLKRFYENVYLTKSQRNSAEQPGLLLPTLNRSMHILLLWQFLFLKSHVNSGNEMCLLETELI